MPGCLGHLPGLLLSAAKQVAISGRGGSSRMLMGSSWALDPCCALDPSISYGALGTSTHLIEEETEAGQG